MTLAEVIELLEEPLLGIINLIESPAYDKNAELQVMLSIAHKIAEARAVKKFGTLPPEDTQT